MSAPASSSIVISCPHCGTRYEVARDALGRRGRQVQCANCGKAWQAEAELSSDPIPFPKPPKIVDPPLSETAESKLDEEFSAEARLVAAKQAEVRQTDQAPGPGETKAAAIGIDASATETERQRMLDEIKAVIAPRKRAQGEKKKLDARQRLAQQQAFSRRQADKNSRLPMARLRRTARIVSLAGLIIVIGGSFWGRSGLVRQFPSLAGVYAALGLPVNVVGLDFRHVHTLKSLQQGNTVLVVDADIVSVSKTGVRVPPIIVTLLDKNGAGIYQWSVTAKANELEPGEVVGLETQMTAPPPHARSVKLSFATGAPSAVPAQVTPVLPNLGKGP